MKHLKKLSISAISIILMLLISLTLPIQVMAETIPSATPDEVSAEISSTTDEKQIDQGNIIGEDTTLRDEYTKYFITDTGCTIAAQYAVPVHYKDDSGEYVNYDNSLISSQAPNSEATADEATSDEISAYSIRTTEETEDTFTNKKSNSKVSHFKKSGKAKLIEITRDGHTISWGYSGANIVTAKEQESENTKELTGNDAYLTLTDLSSTIIYENIYNNIDLEVINSTTGVKENLILKSSNAKNVFKIEYNIGDLTAESADSQTIELKDNSGKVVYTISAPYMKDANGETSEALELKILSNNKGKLSVKLTADKTWLKDKSRVYPVTVDPYFWYESDYSKVSCTFIGTATADTPRGNEQSVYVGTDGVHDELRALIRVNDINSLIENKNLSIGDMIVDARLNMYVWNNGIWKTTYVGLYEASKTWHENTVTWNDFVTPEDETDGEGHNKALVDYRVINSDDMDTWVNWDITEIVKKWYDTSTNNGFVLKVVDGQSINQCIDLCSSNFDNESNNVVGDIRPYFEITYRNNKGLENYWSYTAIDCGRAGTAYINDYSGNLVFEMPIASTASPILAANLSYFYNSYYAYNKYDTTKPYNGWGWRMNIQQTVFKTSGDLSVEYPYVYTDADGTEHYFCPKVEGNVTKYYDEDGLGLELVESDNTYKIITKDDDVLEFNSSGLLAKNTNKSGQYVTIKYVEDTNQIKSVLDSEGYSISFSSLNQYDYVLQIKDCDDKVTKITYSGIYLKTVTYNDSQTITFGYDNVGKLTSVTDVDKSKVEFSYSNYGSKGVISVCEKGTSGTLGQKITFDRSKYNTTVMRTSGTNGSFGDSDDIVTTCQFDNFGLLTSTNSKTADGEYLSASDATYTGGTVNSDASNIKTINKVSQAYTIGANKDNLLVNHSMESIDTSTEKPTNWTEHSWGSSDVNFSITSTANGIYGPKTMKMDVTSCASNACGRVYQDISASYLEANATYTLSCYVKTENITPAENANKYGAVVCATLFNGSSDIGDYFSDYITTNTDTNINNGFRRISVTFTTPSTTEFTKVRINLALRAATGTVYFEGAQLEKAPAAGHYNMLENASFERVDSSSQPTGWTGIYLTSNSDYIVSEHEGADNCYRITGSTTKWKNLYQNVYLNSDAKEYDTYIFSGWAAGNSVPIGSNNARFRIFARVYYTDGEYVDKADLSFNDTLAENNWQYVSGAFNLSDENDEITRTPSYIKVYLVYNYQGNSGYFDNLMLTKEAVPSYTYDSEGNLISVVANAAQTSNYEYIDTEEEITAKDHLITKYINPNSKEYTYKYNDNKQIKSVTTPSGLTANYTYDGKGNANSVELTHEGTEETTDDDLKLSESLTYTYSEGVYPTYSVKSINQRGMESTWRYDAKDGTLTGYTDSRGYSTTYSYHSENDILDKIISGDQIVSYAYTDNFKYRTGITHGNTSYSFTYDEFGNAATTSVGNRTLATNTYYGNNGNLKKITYGNGDYAEYFYDSFGNISSIKQDGTITAENYANSRGDIIRSVDKVNYLEFKATYDTTGRLVSRDVYSTASNSWARSTEYDYDVLNNISKLSFSYNNGTSNTTRYSYTEDNLPLTTLLDNNETLNYKYDGLNRLTQKVLYTSTKVITDYTYLPSLTNLEAYTTNMIDTEVSNAFAYSYYYDNNGNITKIQNGTKQSDGTYTYSASSGNKYEYDRYNQLTKDTDYDNGTVTTYTYDTNGNITQKSVAYGSDTTTTSYTYNDSQGWSDLLTSYNGEAITYDAIGNPLTYRDGMTMEWQNGRELAMCDYGTAYNVYRYDLDGMRASKTIVALGGNIKYVKYIYENGLLLQMDYDGYVFNFSYDANGSPIGFHVKNGSYIDAYYYYGLNSRGDVEALYNANGTIYAKYEYDAYGRLLGITDVDGYTISSAYDIAVLNPLRYRGYVYDSETGLYYLQSRYYDPVTCRFINADSYVSTGQGITGNNMFAYCNNNPVMHSDVSGTRHIASMTVGSETYDEHEVTFAVMNNRPVPDSNVGAAEPYVDIPEGYNVGNKNCYSYAISSPVNEQPGATSGLYPTAYNDVNNVAISVKADLLTKGYTVREIDGPMSKVYDNEFKIALRVGTTPYDYTNRGQPIYDYHFMRQTDTGQWAEKHGSTGGTVLWGYRLTPNNIPWTLYDDIPYYDSSIIYFAVGN